ncbi:hypothetical protein C8Q74DRAFT_46603 [Fomes fomentarius]|nr:hypothetical protein C8Q74DRAFT_46603 [Fomes fomentarius]
MKSAEKLAMQRWLMDQTAPWPRCAMAGAQAKLSALQVRVGRLRDSLERLERDANAQLNLTDARRLETGLRVGCRRQAERRSSIAWRRHALVTQEAGEDSRNVAAFRSLLVEGIGAPPSSPAPKRGPGGFPLPPLPLVLILVALRTAWRREDPRGEYGNETFSPTAPWRRTSAVARGRTLSYSRIVETTRSIYWVTSTRRALPVLVLLPTPPHRGRCRTCTVLAGSLALAHRTQPVGGDVSRRGGTRMAAVALRKGQSIPQ